MLGAQGLWAGRDPYHATPAAIRDLGFSGLIRGTAPINCLLRLATESFNAEDLLSVSSQGPIQLPLATCKGMLKIYSCPDPHGFIHAWTTALQYPSVYMSIYLEKILGNCQELPRYFYSIPQTATREEHSEWVSYDEQFRLKKGQHHWVV
jgi:hypothetical protein